MSRQLSPQYEKIIARMAQKKIGRNDPCWCGSGKKYKKCHATRSDGPPQPYYRLATQMRQLMRGSPDCLHPARTGRCNNPVIRAHSISKSAALTKIARDGHVYQANADPFEIQKQGGQIEHKLVGINLATTFTGFCNEHDAQLFRPIDQQNLAPTSEQSLLLHYRALCRELYVKRPTLKTNELWREADRGKPPATQLFVQDLVNHRRKAIESAIRELEASKATCDKAIREADFTEFRGCVLTFDEIPTLACSGLTHPVYDFSGKILQSLTALANPASMISFTLLPAGSGGIGVFGWTSESGKVCSAFATSFLAVPDDRKTDAIVQLIFDSFENHVAQPDWWENLPDEVRSDLRRRILNWTDFRPVDTKALQPTNYRYGDWRFRGCMWIGLN